MRILYLSTSEIPSKTANSVHVMKMCQAFSSIGNDVTLFGLKKPYNDNVFKYYGVEENFNLIRYDRLNIKGLGSLWNAKKNKSTIMRMSDVDLLYGRDIYSLFLCRKIGIKIVYESHALPASPIHELMEKLLFKSKYFAKMVVISEALKKAYLNENSLLGESDILVAPDGADIPKNTNEEKGLSHLFNSEINIGYVGHLYPGRGIEVIIELAKIFKYLKFHIIGGMEKDILFWKNESKDLQNVLFHGYIPNGQLGSYYKKIDIMLAPYQNVVRVAGDKGDTSKWMSPMKIFEYMAYKKAIIASDIPVLKEVLSNDSNCMLCTPDDVKEWERALKKLVDDKSLRSRLGNRAYLDLSNKYTWNNRATAICSNLD